MPRKPKMSIEYASAIGSAAADLYNAHGTAEAIQAFRFIAKVNPAAVAWLRGALSAAIPGADPDEPIPDAREHFNTLVALGRSFGAEAEEGESARADSVLRAAVEINRKRAEACGLGAALLLRYVVPTPEAGRE